MCGIVAIFNYRQNASPVDQNELKNVRDAMIPRGPDDCGLWVSDDKQVGLGHRRLSIIDLSEAGRQPMSTKDGCYYIVFNGEIYNYRELRGELEQKGYRFHSHSDTEVLLQLYADKGEKMVNYLRGMFAFAIFDQSTKSLFIARDHFGIKPLYYSDNGQTIRIASQVKALLKSSAVDRSDNPAGHVGFFLWGSVPEPHTLYKGIKALPAGSTMLVNDQGISTNNFFSVADTIVKFENQSTHCGEAEIQDKLQSCMQDTIKHHLIADVPVGIFLSAGLDSTTLLGLVSEVASKEVRTITLGFKEYAGSCDDEVPLAEEIAHYYKSKQSTDWIEEKDFIDEYSSILNAMDQPSFDGVNTYFVSKIAAESGLKVALSGLGGDELFGGYVTFSQVSKMVNYLSWTRLIPFLGVSSRNLLKVFIKRSVSPKYASLIEFGNSFVGSYFLRRGLFMPWELSSFLDCDLVREGIRQLNLFEVMGKSVGDIKDPFFKVMALEMQYYMRNQLLRDSDWASMAHSVEIRVPLVDIALFNTMLKMSKHRHLSKNDMSSFLLKPLPKQLLERKKSGFNVPVGRWCSRKNKQSRFDYGLRDWAKTVYDEMT